MVLLVKLNHTTQDSTTLNDVSYPIMCVCVCVVMMCLYLLSPQPINPECGTSSHYIFNPGHLLWVADRCCQHRRMCT